jgi:hypothetical protein
LWKLLGQDTPQPAFVRLVQSARVMGYQGSKTRRETLANQPASPIKGVEASVNDAWRVAHIMKPSRSGQQISIYRDNN